MIKAYLNKDGTLIKYEPYELKEVVLDFDISDALVNDSDSNDVVLLQKSTQAKKLIEELQSKKELDEFEKAELEYLLPKTHMVNVTTEDDKKHYVIHEISEGIDFDASRGDMKFSSKEKAQEYANTFNS